MKPKFSRPPDLLDGAIECSDMNLVGNRASAYMSLLNAA
jgi:hypothetical protein